MTVVAQRSFTGGELAPALQSRVDQAKYQTAAKTLRNGIVMRGGGFTNRPGTTFGSTVKYPGQAVRMVEFKYSDTENYVLEFGYELATGGYMRAHANGTQVRVPLSITAIAQQAIGGLTGLKISLSGTFDLNQVPAGSHVYISGVVGTTGLNGKWWLISAVGANYIYILPYEGTTSVTLVSVGGAWVSGGTAEGVVEISTPYEEDMLAALQFQVIGAALIVTSPDEGVIQYDYEGPYDWSRTSFLSVPQIAPPGGLSNSGAAGSATEWAVTTVDQESVGESGTYSTTSSSATPSAGSPITVSWLAVSGALEYNVYRKVGGTNGIFGLVGVSRGTSFADTGGVPDLTVTPPYQATPFSTVTDGFPEAVGLLQQRVAFGNTPEHRNKVFLSQPGRTHNFNVSSPIQDDDSVTFTLLGRAVSQVRHMLEAAKTMYLFTSGGVWALGGNESGILTPIGINPQELSQVGCAKLRPLVIGDVPIYLHARQSVVRDLSPQSEQNGVGSELTIFASHLVDKNTIIDWCYQETPHRVVWAVRDDGVLLGMTYIREHQIVAWHRHDTDGIVENVACIPEGDEDFVYLVVKRTIDGEDVRYVERLASRLIDDRSDSVFMDSSLAYDGRNTGSATMTLSGGSAWDESETLTCTASTAQFTASDVGNEVHLYVLDDDGEISDTLRCAIEAYTNSTHVTVRTNKTAPASLQGVATTHWARAVDEVSGLFHLEGKAVSVLADGMVAASPYNPDYETVTVTSGVATLDACAAVIRVGLPYVSDLQTLDIDTAQTETLAGKKSLVNKVTIHVDESAGVFVGTEPPSDDDTDALERLYELKIDRDLYEGPSGLISGKVDQVIDGRWETNGRVFLRQVDPLPMTILAVMPAGFIPLGA
jgi:hypothetical protein